MPELCDICHEELPGHWEYWYRHKREVGGESYDICEACASDLEWKSLKSWGLDKGCGITRYWSDYYYVKMERAIEKKEWDMAFHYLELRAWWMYQDDSLPFSIQDEEDQTGETLAKTFAWRSKSTKHCIEKKRSQIQQAKEWYDKHGSH